MHAQLVAREPGGDVVLANSPGSVLRSLTGELCMVIGDVTGSGLHAAVIMGRMRSALRAYALETNDPAEVLSRLDRKMQHFEPDALATVLYASARPCRRAARTAAWRSATVLLRRMKRTGACSAPRADSPGHPQHGGTVRGPRTRRSRTS
jgi:hypothetical protein